MLVEETPREKSSTPVHATITPLSVHSLAGGKNVRQDEDELELLQVSWLSLTVSTTLIIRLVVLYMY